MATVNKRLDEWVSDARLDITTLQPAPKKEEKKLQGAAAHKVGDPDRPRKHPGGRKRKVSELGDALPGTASASEAGTDVCEESRATVI